VLLAVLTLSCGAVAAKPAGTSVYVTSTAHAAGSASDEDARGLAEAARELREAISRKKGLRVVDDPGAADVEIEVTNREERESGDGGFGGIKLTPLGEKIIRFHAKFTPHENGTHLTDEADLKGTGPGYWSRAAADGATRLAKWIANHQRGPYAPSAREKGGALDTRSSDL